MAITPQMQLVLLQSAKMETHKSHYFT